MLGPVELVGAEDHGTILRINYVEEGGKEGYLDGDRRPMQGVINIWGSLGQPKVWIDFEDEEGPTVHFISPDGVDDVS
jgi:hypothetical protein